MKKVSQNWTSHKTITSGGNEKALCSSQMSCMFVKIAVEIVMTNSVRTAFQQLGMICVLKHEKKLVLQLILSINLDKKL